MSRRVCTSCNEELSHSAYFRHLNDQSGSICPGRSGTNTTMLSAIASEQAVSDTTLDSTFELEDEDDCTAFSDTQGDMDSFAPETPNTSTDTTCTSFQLQSSDDDSDVESSPDEEIWEESDSEVEEDQNVTESIASVVSGVFLFLNVFRLVFRISERGMLVLISFLKMLFSHVAKVCQNAVVLEIAKVLPTSLYKLQKKFKIGSYTTYAVCPKCCSLYEVEKCIVGNGCRQESRLCDHIEFPNHPHSSKREKCGTVLMKRIRVGQKFKLVPRKIFVYRSIIQTLKEMSRRQGFLQLCEHWRGRKIPDAALGDIYDGKIWQDADSIEGTPFLAVPNNLCLGLNIDWFNPYEETQYSAGAIYLNIFNLPRAERFKLENIILVGMIPGPKEPTKLNPFLSPLVTELEDLYAGVTFRNSASVFSVSSVRAILLAVMCDLPATRKVCGFANFNALKGCSKCLKEFPTHAFGEKPDFSGFDVETWACRDLATHKRIAKKAKSANSDAERKRIEKSYGAKFSKLLDLPYFDNVRQHVIDPMHNFFLGMAKHAFKTWRDLDILSKRNCSAIQEIVDDMNPPPKVGRIPRKIDSGFASLTADEWKHWILMYSLYALHDILPSTHYKCWSLFVDSCRILTLPIISPAQIERGHMLLVDYCKEFETLYGNEHLTPNMHMACHMKECMLDYGPLSSFWCFAFERYNGTLENVSKSWNCPEKQMFTKFLGRQYMYNIQTQSVAEREGTPEDDFVKAVCEKSLPVSKQFESAGSFNLATLPDVITCQQLRNYQCAVSSVEAEEKPYQQLTPPLREKCWSDVEVCYLHTLYSHLYPNSNLQHISRFYYQSKQLNVNNEQFSSTLSRSQRSCTVAAHWQGVVGIDSRGEAPLRVGVVKHFLRHEITLLTEEKSKKKLNHILACVEWYMDHPRRDFLHSPIILAATVFEADSAASLIPVSRIAARCAVAKTRIRFDYGEDSVTVAVPLLKYVTDSE